jgi:hypothetical protein
MLPIHAQNSSLTADHLDPLLLVLVLPRPDPLFSTFFPLFEKTPIFFCFVFLFLLAYD